ncbi:MAG: ATP-binding protein [Bacteroidales bacterium]|nr:ATP-binding protein [Bacteroidales bacterium]
MTAQKSQKGANNVVLRRKIYRQLLDWKHDRNGEVALLIEGARRIGKSYIVEQFAMNEYESYILIDFNKAPQMVRDWFDLYLEDLDTLFLYLSQHYKVRLFERRSLIILDEVQLCPRARAAIKFLVADGRYDYIETGSLVSIKKNTQGIVLPSEERPVQMYPLDFEEFLWATGDDLLMDLIRKMFAEYKPMGQAFHRQAMDAFRLYMIVGGMPQAVLKYVETRDFDAVDAAKRDVLTIYRNDIFNYAAEMADKVASVFDHIPSQLSKHEKKFRLSALTPGAKYRDWDDAFFWLKDARVVNVCYNSTEPNIGLKMNEDRTTLKCYMNDTGLLISHAFDEKGIVSSEIYQKLLFGKLEVNEGMLIENVVAQMLTASGNSLFFYSKASTEAQERMEIDFLLQKDKVTSRHNIRPIEVKSGKNYTLSSLSKCTKRFAEYMTSPTVLHADDYKLEDGVTYLPLYMTPLL